MRMRLWFASLVLLMLASVGTADAQTSYPTQQDPYINDFANLLSAEQDARLRDMLVTLQRDHGVTLVVVTIQRMADYNTSAPTIESFATGLFNRWAIDDAETNDGILFLTAVGDRRVRIEVGAGYGTALDDRVDDVIDEIITPAYRRNDYARGIEQGVAGIIRIVTGQAPVPSAATPPDAGSTSLLIPFAIAALVIGALVWFASRVTGSAPAPYNMPEGGGGEPVDGSMGDVRTPGFWGDGEGDRIHSGFYDSDDDDDDSQRSSRSSSSWSSSRRSSGSSRSSSSRGGSSRGGGASGSW